MIVLWAFLIITLAVRQYSFAYYQKNALHPLLEEHVSYAFTPVKTNNLQKKQYGTIRAYFALSEQSEEGKGERPERSEGESFLSSVKKYRHGFFRADTF